MYENERRELLGIRCLFPESQKNAFSEINILLRIVGGKIEKGIRILTLQVLTEMGGHS
jgi:hypothetical protein